MCNYYSFLSNNIDVSSIYQNYEILLKIYTRIYGFIFNYSKLIITIVTIL